MSECENYILGKDETLVFVARAMDMGVFCMIEEKFDYFLWRKGEYWKNMV